jgi:hypothetical protein
MPPDVGNGPPPLDRTGLCRILQTDFREFHFPRTPVNKGKKRKGPELLRTPVLTLVRRFAYATRVVVLLCWPKSARKP